MNKFEELGLSAELLKGITELGFTEPTPVQAKVIPMLVKGLRDVVALAQTGTGKTAAFGLPLLQLTDAKVHATQAVVLCPTRELCLQIARDLSDFSRFASHLRVVAVYGGTSIMDQIRALHRGAHIIVATPGRMNDLLRRGAAKLEKVQRVVLDEADEMLNMGFQEELESILKEIPDTARTLLFSATMPKSVATIASKYLNDPEEIIIGTRNAGASKVTHECYTVHARDRYSALKRIIDCLPAFYGIVFCRTRIETQDIASKLMADGYNSDALHGDMSQDQRDRVMKAFRNRTLQILVATDVAARGLDVDDLTHVINFDLPGDPEVYVHRSGRTGRAGKTGVSIVLAHMREDYKIRGIERIMNKRFEHKKVPTGREVLEAQLVALLEKVKAIEATETAKLDEYLPKINEVLGDMSREEIIKRFVLGDFNRFLSYYRNAAELNVNVSHGRRDDRPDRGPRPERAERPVHADRPPMQQGERPERPDRGPRASSYDRHDPSLRRERPVDDPIEGGVVKLRVNIGKMNNLTVPELITLINRNTPGPMLKLGHIRIMEQDSVFEVAQGAEEILVPTLSKAVFNERPVRCVVEHDTTHGVGPKPRPSYHERRNKPGAFMKKKFHRGKGPRPFEPQD